jgi:mRNA interferase MazF
MKRGDVYWIDFEYPDKRRPAIVLTRNSAIGYLAAVTVAPLTTTIRGLPTEVVLGPADGLAMECVANLDSIQTMRKSRISSLVTTLTESKMAAIENALAFALGMEHRLR